MPPVSESMSDASAILSGDPRAFVTPNPGLALVGAFMALGSMTLPTMLCTALILFIMLAQTYAGNFSVVALAVSFVVGALSDIALNLYFRGSRALRPRGAKLRQYFDAMGMLPAAVFAGAISATLTLATVAAASAFHLRPPARNSLGGIELRETAIILVLGFAAGAGFGVFAQPTRAIAPLLPFYQSTSGLLENRAWDGASQVWVMLWVAAAALAIAPAVRNLRADGTCARDGDCNSESVCCRGACVDVCVS